jgi:hypothetical protein
VLIQPAAADPLRQPAPTKPASTQPLRPPTTNPCAAFGPGFVRIEGSDSCIKLGGATSIGGGGSTR